ncbi:glycoside hydrolase family 125 protein [Tardiphaga sp. vice352]|uniref:glycoside hydrolase family 125 protein n=1 Tax=Tardiphaga sp. vice352 TaxID=2592816 RepID=UPI001164025F|nr:glycoside hydrolase family 125 protein [Tardiphaga sp. vice352]QDM32179.1 glycoside hydrolase family 125 protein [Tardiphaga sp. vice352]
MTIAPMEVTLAGNVVSLEMTSKSMMRVSEYFGGLIPANSALLSVDLQAMRKILASGLNKPLSDDDGLEAAIYETGVIDVQKYLIDYLDKLVTGGRGSPKPAVK